MEKPEWFTDRWKKLVPEHMIPKRQKGWGGARESIGVEDGGGRVGWAEWRGGRGGRKGTVRRRSILDIGLLRGNLGGASKKSKLNKISPALPGGGGREHPKMDVEELQREMRVMMKSGSMFK